MISRWHAREMKSLARRPDQLAAPLVAPYVRREVLGATVKPAVFVLPSSEVGYVMMCPLAAHLPFNPG